MHINKILKKFSAHDKSNPLVDRLEKLERVGPVLWSLVKAWSDYHEKMASHTAASLLYSQAMTSLLFIDNAENLSPTFTQTIDLFSETLEQIAKVENVFVCFLDQDPYFSFFIGFLISLEEASKWLNEVEELLGEFDQVEGRIGNDSISNNTTTTTTNKESRKPMDPVDRYLLEVRRAKAAQEFNICEMDLEQIVERLEGILEHDFVECIIKYYHLKLNMSGVIFTHMDGIRDYLIQIDAWCKKEEQLWMNQMLLAAENDYKAREEARSKALQEFLKIFDKHLIEKCCNLIGNTSTDISELSLMRPSQGGFSALFDMANLEPPEGIKTSATECGGLPPEAIPYYIKSNVAELLPSLVQEGKQELAIDLGLRLAQWLAYSTWTTSEINTT